MASQSRDFGDFVNNATVGTIAWVDPANAAALDAAYALASNIPLNARTNYLGCTNPAPAYAIPADAIILDIEIIVNRRGSANAIKDNIVKYVKGGAIQGSNLASTDFWPSTYADKTYSGLAGLSWTPADFGSGFGMVLSAKNTISGLKIAGIDYIHSKVYFALVAELDEAQSLLDALTKETGKNFTEAMTATDILTLLVKISDTANVTITDACTPVKLLLQSLSDTVTLDDMVEFIRGRYLTENMSLQDQAVFTTMLSKALNISMTDAIKMLITISKAEAVTLTDEIERLFMRTLTEGVSVTDQVSSYIFRPNKPLMKYDPVFLIDINAAAGVQRFSTKNIYVTE